MLLTSVAGLLALLVGAVVLWLTLPCRLRPPLRFVTLAQRELVPPRLWVVFDNNAYQSLSDSRFRALYQCESGRGVRGLASYWVAIELLSHLADPADKDFRPAWAAVRRLWRHCCDDGRNVRWLADSENHACHTLFGEAIPGRQEEAAAYGHLLGTIAHAREPSDWEPLQAGLEYLANHVRKIEQQFRDDMWQYVVLSVNPRAGGWRPLDTASPLRKRLMMVFQGDEGRNLSARMIVLKAAAELGRQLTAAETQEKTLLVRQAFPIAVEFYNSVLTAIVEHGFDLDDDTKRNAIWDLQIAYSASPAARLNGCPVWLVSSDRMLRRAAKSAGNPEITRSLSDYEGLVKGPVTDFLDSLC